MFISSINQSNNKLEENTIRRLNIDFQLMSLLKVKNRHPSKLSIPAHFRTIVKSRVNKQTIKDIVQLSPTIQGTLDENKKCPKSTKSIYKNKSDTESTDKMKDFIRNMKILNQKKQQYLGLKAVASIENRDLINSRASSRSLRSNISNHSNFISMHIEKNNHENNYIVSTRSIFERENQSKSKISLIKENEESKQKTIDKLNNMEEKIELLVKTKLKNLMLKAQQKNRYQTQSFLQRKDLASQVTEYEDDALEKQITDIIQSIGLLKQKQSEGNSQPQLFQNIRQLEKKIQLIEKILASNFTQAEIRRKYYFAKKSQKCSHLSRKDKIIQQIQKRKTILKSNLIDSNYSKSKNLVLNYQTTSNLYFSKPAKNSYENSIKYSKPFAFNRQPIPRSTYEREFLNYGTLPVFNYRPQDNKHATSHMNFKTSTYQETFKIKNIEMKQIDFRQLDCVKNKLKPGSISFSKMFSKRGTAKKKHQSNQNQILQNDSKDRRQNRKNSIQKTIDSLNNMQKLTKLEQSKIKFMGQSEIQRSFVWHNPKSKDNEKQLAKNTQNCEPKDRRLNAFKNAYKIQFVR